MNYQYVSCEWYITWPTVEISEVTGNLEMDSFFNEPCGVLTYLVCPTEQIQLARLDVHW